MAAVVKIDFNKTHKCPEGSLALLPGIGLCTVIGSTGFDRLMSYKQEPSDSKSEVTRTVPVQQLRHLNPWKDLTGSQNSDKFESTNRFYTDVILVY